MTAEQPQTYFVTSFHIAFLGDTNINAEIRVMSPVNVVQPIFDANITQLTKDKEKHKVHIDGSSFIYLLHTLPIIYQHTKLLSTNDNSELFIDISPEVRLFVRQKTGTFGGSKYFVTMILQDVVIEKELNQQIINTSMDLKAKIEQSMQYVAHKIQSHLAEI